MSLPDVLGGPFGITRIGSGLVKDSKWLPAPRAYHNDYRMGRVKWTREHYAFLTVLTFLPINLALWSLKLSRGSSGS